jgi:hypothetical protein
MAYGHAEWMHKEGILSEMVREADRGFQLLLIVRRWVDSLCLVCWFVEFGNGNNVGFLPDGGDVCKGEGEVIEGGEISYANGAKEFKGE